MKELTKDFDDIMDMLLGLKIFEVRFKPLELAVSVGLQCYSVTLTSDNIDDVLGNIVDWYDKPFLDTEEWSRMVVSHCGIFVKDESFKGGYNNYAAYLNYADGFKWEERHDGTLFRRADPNYARKLVYGY